MARPIVGTLTQKAKRVARKLKQRLFRKSFKASRKYEHLVKESMLICAPVVVGKKGYHRDVLEDLRSQGFVRARVNGAIVDLRDVLLA